MTNFSASSSHVSPSPNTKQCTIISNEHRCVQDDLRVFETKCGSLVRTAVLTLGVHHTTKTEVFRLNQRQMAGTNSGNMPGQLYLPGKLFFASASLNLWLTTAPRSCHTHSITSDSITIANRFGDTLALMPHPSPPPSLLSVRESWPEW